MLRNKRRRRNWSRPSRGELDDHDEHLPTQSRRPYSEAAVDRDREVHDRVREAPVTVLKRSMKIMYHNLTT